MIGPLLALGVWLTAVSLAERPGGGRRHCRGFIATGVAALPAFVLWPLLATIHAFLASGKKHSLADLGEYVRQARYDTTKTAVVTLSRLALLVLLFINLHLLVEAGLWVLNSLAGFDAAFVALQMTLANPVYDLALVLLAWLLLAPFFEASNFLLHVDARTRQEGLDLQIRVQNVFPTAERRRVGALAVLIGVFSLGPAPPTRRPSYDAVHTARADVERIAGEVKTAEPYDGARWEPELRQTADSSGTGGRPRSAGFALGSRTSPAVIETTPCACWTTWTNASAFWKRRCRATTDRKKPTPKTILKSCYSSRARAVRSWTCGRRMRRTSRRKRRNPRKSRRTSRTTNRAAAGRITS